MERTQYKYYANYDILRIIACFFVCAQHSMGTHLPDAIGILPTIYVGFISETALFIFFALSGAFLLSRPYAGLKPLFARIVKLFVPAIIFMAIWIVVCSPNISSWPMLLMQSVWHTALGPYWFVYSLIGLYLLLPILRRWVHAASRKEVEVYILLWLVTSCLPVFYLLGLNKEFALNGWARYIAGPIGPFLIGYYILRYVDVSSIKSLIIGILLSIIGLALPAIESSLGIDYIGLWEWDFGATALASGIMLCTLFLCRNLKESEFLRCTSRLTYGIFLIHQIIICLLERSGIYAPLPTVPQFLLLTASTILISYLISYLFSLFPLTRPLIALASRKAR